MIWFVYILHTYLLAPLWNYGTHGGPNRICCITDLQSHVSSPDAEEDLHPGVPGGKVHVRAGRPQAQRLGESGPPDTCWSPTSWKTVGFVTSVAVCCPGAAVGAADEGAEAGREAEEGAGAALRPAAHRVQPHAIRDADAGHTRSQVPAAQSHGERGETRQGGFRGQFLNLWCEERRQKEILTMSKPPVEWILNERLLPEQAGANCSPLYFLLKLKKKLGMKS